MSGTSDGARKGNETKKKLYGDDFFNITGFTGGIKSTGGGFASDKRGKDGLTGKERSRFYTNKRKENKESEELDNGISITTNRDSE